MAKQIDERVVSMQFDNQKFEKNVSVTLHSLENLKGKLSGVGDAVKNFGNLDKAAKKADFTPLANSVEAVRVKFSALEIMGITALTNITNSAVNAGKRIVKALAFDSITTGFSEYETKINSVQTIMSNTASKGKTMEDVTRVLDELNTYADKTIYNFAEMTKNIGTFTAAGVDLEDSAKAIQGIANLAASSGSTSQQASTAMYQLSQALAAGTVKLMDWNSVVNAGMGGEKFQNALKQTAREHGVAVDKIIKKQGSFRESLSEGWITADILNETLNKFTVDGANKYANAMLKSGKYTKAQADALIKEAHAMEDAATKVKTFTQLWDTMKESAQSGWAQTWELIVGDFEEAKEFFSEISEMFGKVIGDSANARNKLIGDAMGSKWETLSEKITKAGISTDDFMKKLKSTAKSSGIPIDKLIKKYGSLEKVIKAGKIPVDVFVKTLKKFAGATEQTSKSADKVTKKVENLEKVVKQVINGDFGNGEKRMKALAKAGYDYATVQDLVNKTLKGEKVNYDKLSDSQLKNMGYTKDQVKAIRELAKEAEKSGTPINELIKDLEKPSGRELLLDSLINSLKGVGNILGTVKKAWRDTFAPMSSDSLYNIVEGLNEMTSKFKKFTENKDTIDKLTRTFKGLFAVLDIISTFTTGALKFAIKTLGKILGIADLDVLNITASIGDMLVAFRDWLLKNNAVVKGIKKFGDVAKDAVKFIGGLVKSFLELPGVQRVMSLFSNAVKKSFGGVGDYLTEGIDRFRDFIDRSKSLDGGFNLDNLKKIFKDFKDNVFDYFFDFDKMFDNVQKNFEEFKEKSKYHLEKAGDGFSWFINKLKELADTVRKETDFGSIVAMGMGVGLLSIFKKFGDALETLSDIAKGFDMTPITKGVGNVLNRFADMEKAMAFKIKVKAIQGLVVAIVALAGAVAVLTKLDQGKMWSAIGGLVVLIGAMAGLSFAISKMGEINVNFSKGASAILIFAGAVFILVTCLKKMDSLNPDKLMGNVTALVILIGALGGVAILLSKYAPQLSKGTGALIIMAISVRILAGALDTLTGINLGDGIKALFFMALLIGAIFGLSKACGMLKAKSALSIIAAVIALKMLIGVIDDIAEIDLNKIKNNIGAFATIFGAFVGVMWAASKAGSKSVGAGIGVIAMAASLLLIIKAIKLIDDIDDATLDRSLKVISKIMGIFGGLIAASALAGKNAIKAGTMLILMAGAMLVMTIVIAILKHMSPEGLDQALDAINQIAFIFSVLISATYLAKDAKGVIIALTVAIGLMGGMLIALSFLDPTKLRNATLALSSVIGVFSLLVLATTKLKGGKAAFNRLVKTMLVLVGVVAVLAYVIFQMSKIKSSSTLEASTKALATILLALSGVMFIIGNTKTVRSDRMKTACKSMYQLTGVLAIVGVVVGALAVVTSKFSDPKTLITSSTALSEVMIALAGVMFVLGNMKTVSAAKMKTASKTMLKLSGVMAVVGVVLAAVAVITKKYSNAETLTKSAEAICMTIISLTGVMAVLSAIGGKANMATAALKPLGILIGAIGGIVGALGGLMQIPGAKTVVEDGVEAFGKIGEAIGGFIGGIVGGIAGGTITAIGNSLPKFGTNLSMFMKNINGFIKGLEGIKPATLENANVLSDVIMTISKASILESISSWLGGESSITKFAEDIGELGKGLVDFTESVEELSEGDIAKASMVATMLKALTSAAKEIPNSGGVLGFFAGENDIGQFVLQLAGTGKNLMTFANSVKDFKKSDIEPAKNAAAAIGAMAKAAKEIPNSGGVLGFFAGDNDIDAFVFKLTGTGKSLMTFAADVKDFTKGDIEPVKNAAAAISVMATAAKEIPNADGVIQWFMGEKDIGCFTEKLADSGKNLRDLVDNIGTFGDPEIATVKAAATAVAAMAEAAKGIDIEGNWLERLFGTDDFTVFSEKLPLLGAGLYLFAKNLNQLRVEAIQVAIDLVSGMAKLASIKDLGVATKGMLLFTTGLLKSSKGLVQAVSKLSEIDEDAVNESLVAVESLQNISDKLAGIKFEHIDALGNSLKDVAEKGINSFTNTFTGNNALTKIKNSVSAMIDTFTTAIGAKTANVTASFEKLINLAIMSIKNVVTYTKFYNIGTYIVQGLAAGIENSSWMAEAKARAVINATEQAAREAADVNSPSKLFMRLGYSLPEGLAVGIDKMTHLATSSATKMVDTVSGGANKAISSIVDGINSNMDVQPTIRPVLDLSDVSSGANRIGRMLNMNPSIGVMSNINAISSMMNSNQNGVNDDVISAINKLGNTISGMPRNTYNVNGVTYDDGSNIANAVESIARAAIRERRI